MAQQNSLVGHTLGQYQILDEVGGGGMAMVYKAWQPSLRRYVALKVLLPHLSSDTEFVQRFHQEAVSAANLKHTNIVTIHDVSAESGYHYIAMELIEGASLEEHIRSGQAFAPEQVVDSISQIGSALDYAHQRGFIHRDVKPANILIDASGRAVLTDFGIVKALSGSGVTSALTRAGTVFGTPHYMSPEQVRDEPLDHRSDLYSLGIVCYEMLTGQAPFDGTTTHAILYAQVNDLPPPLRQVVGPAVPAPVEPVVNKMLAKEREMRYNSGGEFAHDLAQAVSGVWPASVGGQTVVATPREKTELMPPGAQPTAYAPEMTQPWAQPPQPSWPQQVPYSPPPKKKKRPGLMWALIGSGVAVLIVATVVGGLLLGLMLGKDDPLKNGQDALAAGDYAQAADWFSQALESDPDNAEAIEGRLEAVANLAQDALATGDYAQAANWFSQVLESDPDNGEAIEGQLEAAANLAQAGQFDAAVTAYETVWQAKPEEARALQSLGQTYEAEGEWEEAAGWYEKWTQAAPEDENAFLALGNARFNLGEYESAVTAYERAKALGADEEALANLDQAYLESAIEDISLDLGFSNIVTEGDETYAIAKTGQKAGIEGAVHLVDGPWEGSQALVVEEGTTNRCRHPGAESDLEIWTSRASPTIWERSSDYPFIGGYSFHFAAPGGSKARAYHSFDATEDQEYTISVYVTKIVSGDSVFTIGQTERDEHEIDAVEGWNTLTFTSAATDRYYFRIGRTASNTPACEVYFDAVQVEDKAYRTTYCDGSLGTGYSWSGAPHDSSSKRIATNVNLDDHASLISDNDRLSFRVVARMPYDVNATWPNTYTVLIDARGAASSDSIRLAYDSDNDIFYVSINGKRRVQAPTRTFGAGEFLEFVLSLDFGNDEYNLYIDGELVGTNTTSLTAPTLSQWKIGCNYDGRGRRAGFAFSEFSIFERALIPGEVAALYGMDLSTR